MNFRNYVMAGYPLLWVETHEEYRVIGSLTRDVNAEYKVFAWDQVSGVHPLKIEEDTLVHKHEDAVAGTGTENAGSARKPPALSALEWFDENGPEGSILFLMDYHNYLGKKSSISAVLTRKIRNLLPKFKAVGKVLAIISPVKDIPIEIDKEVTFIQFKLPNREELKSVLEGVCESAEAPMPEDSELEDVLNASLGMTSIEAENAYSVSLIEKRKYDPEVIQREKASIVRKGGQLEVIDTPETMDDIGGLENLKEWLNNRKNSFSQEARDFGIRPPKGLLLVGVPGCGKSLSAKAVSKVWKRPLLRLDIGRVMGSYVGQSEANLRRSLDIAEAVAPCVLWIDELEKSFAGTGQGETDGHGTTKRVFQEFLTWLQDKKSDVFIIATANDVSALPPELIRPGRIDSIFWVDLPDAKNREEILKIHISKYGFNPDNIDESGMKHMVEMSEGMSGAGIEAWVEEAKVKAFNRGGKSLTEDDFTKSIGDIAKQSGMNVDSARQWALDNGVKPASKVILKKTANKRGRKINSIGVKAVLETDTTKSKKSEEKETGKKKKKGVDIYEDLTRESEE